MDIPHISGRAEIEIRRCPIAGSLVITSLRDGNALRIKRRPFNEQAGGPQLG